MESLHEVFDALAGQPDRSASEMLHDAGYGDLPPELVGDALVSYADTAPVEVAEHLAPFVTAHLGSPDATPDLDAGFGLLSSIPVADADLDAAELAADVAEQPAEAPFSVDVLDFGTGDSTVDEQFDLAEQAFVDAAVETTVDEPAAVDLPEAFGEGVDVDGAGVGEAPDFDGLEPTDG
jgi:hypothetical protein